MKNKTVIIGIIFTIILNIAFLACITAGVLRGFGELLFTIFITLVIFVYHVDVRIVIGFVVTKFFKQKLNINSKKYLVGAKEYRFLDKLKVKYWKDKFVALDKSQFLVSSKDDLERALRNNISAEIIHIICFVAGFFSIAIGCLLAINEWWIYVLTAFLASFLCDLPPILIQRYNRFRLQRIRKRNNLAQL